MDAERDQERQSAARAVVLGVRLFPDLERRLIGVFGPTAAAIALHQLLYWFSRPKMAHREWAYKTYLEWRDERGLNRKQVDKARRVLIGAKVLEERRGQGNRLFYRPDWVNLARTLNLELSVSPLRGSTSECSPIEEQTECPPLGGQPFTEDYAREYEQHIPLAEGAESASAEPAPPQLLEQNQKGEDHDLDAPAVSLTPQEVGEGKDMGDLLDSNAATAPPRLDGEGQHRLLKLLFAFEGPNRINDLVTRLLEGRDDSEGQPITPERIAQEARRKLGGDEPLEAYLWETVRCLEDMRREVAV